MGARTSWRSIPLKTARSDTRPARCTHFLPGRSSAVEGLGKKTQSLPPAVAERPERETSFARWLPHWGVRWVVTPPYSVRGNAEGESSSETPGSLLERERPSCHHYPGSPPLSPDAAALSSRLLVVAKVASMVTYLSCLHFYMDK